MKTVTSLHTVWSKSKLEFIHGVQSHDNCTVYKDAVCHWQSCHSCTRRTRTCQVLAFVIRMDMTSTRSWCHHCQHYPVVVVLQCRCDRNWAFGCIPSVKRVDHVDRTQYFWLSLFLTMHNIILKLSSPQRHAGYDLTVQNERKMTRAAQHPILNVLFVRRSFRYQTKQDRAVG